MKSSLIDKLHALRLNGMVDNLELRMQEAAGNDLGYDDFLELLLDDEICLRDDGRRQRALKRAGFRNLKTLHDFDWQFNRNIDKQVIYELASCNFIRQYQDLLFIGPPGTGKTHLAQAIGYEAIKRNFSVIYRSIFDLVLDFQSGKPNVLPRLTKKYLNCDLLIIDDMGLKVLPEKAGEYLFEIIMRRYETRSTLMTSNRPVEDWGKLIGDVPTAGAILDRLLQNVRLVPFKGRSYRIRTTKSVSMESFNVFGKENSHEK